MDARGPTGVLQSAVMAGLRGDVEGRGVGAPSWGSILGVTAVAATLVVSELLLQYMELPFAYWMCKSELVMEDDADQTTHDHPMTAC